jgi:hypothetical protein
MNAMTCHEVEAQLDLLAAGECDRPTRRAVELHLDQCPTCSASYAESQRLLGLLDLNWNTAGPQRVREWIEREERRARPRPVVLLFVRRAASLAALLLLTLGLTLWLPRGEMADSPPDLQLATLVARRNAPDGIQEAVKAIGDPLARFQPAVEAVSLAVARGHTGNEFRDELEQAQRAGKLPAPDAVPFGLELKNTGTQPLDVRLGDNATELSLHVRGPGVVRIPAAGVAEPDFLRPRTVPVAPGKPYVIRLDRLIAGKRGRLEYIYLTEPGDYTLTASLRLTVGGKVATVTGAVVRIVVPK